MTEQGPRGGANHETNYTYNLRKQLIGVSMPRGGTTQTRTFNYDLATGRLTSVTNPETGTTSYTYNADGSVATRTDARSQHVEYTYDSLGRATQIRRYNSSGVEQTCQRMNYGYDSGTYGWGRLTSTSWGGSSCTGGSWSQSYSYNAPGAVIYKSQNGGGRNDHAHYTYNSEGQLLSTEYPDSGPTFTYTYDSMGRPVKLTDNRTTPLDWAKDVVYNVAGQITEMQYLRANPMDQDNPFEYHSEHRTYNVLGQVTHMHVNNQTNVLNKTYTYSATQNDGRIETMVDAVSGETVEYEYDSLKRLISAETTGTQWGQSFSYDGFGNLLAQTVTKGSAPPLSVLVSGTTNRITSSGYSYLRKQLIGVSMPRGGTTQTRTFN